MHSFIHLAIISFINNVHLYKNEDTSLPYLAVITFWCKILIFAIPEDAIWMDPEIAAILNVVPIEIMQRRFSRVRSQLTMTGVIWSGNWPKWRFTLYQLKLNSSGIGSTKHTHTHEWSTSTVDSIKTCDSGGKHNGNILLENCIRFIWAQLIFTRVHSKGFSEIMLYNTMKLPSCQKRKNDKIFQRTVSWMPYWLACLTSG